jgi:hypothetical protein
MTNDTDVHVQPIVLWQFICGGIDLPSRDYEHIVNCMACEIFGEEICEALGRIPASLHGGHTLN